MPSKRTIIIYTDGSADRDGYGGACAILLYRERIKRVSKGYRPGTFGRYGDVGKNPGTPQRYSIVTNQQMEIMAPILGLAAVKHDWEGPIIIRSDSAYVVNCFRDNWIEVWRGNGWKNSRGKEVANRAFWETLEALVDIHDVAFEKIKGHSNDRYNDEADSRAEWARLEARAVGLSKGETLHDWEDHASERRRRVRARRSGVRNHQGRSKVRRKPSR